MTTLRCAMLMGFFLLPLRVSSQTPDARKLAGRWSGAGTFFDADLQKKVGSIPMAMSFTAGRARSGTIGKATLADVHTAKVRDHIEVKAKLTGVIGAAPELAKNHVVLVITAVTDSTLRAEFHLKSNFTYDPRMREGHVVLTRIR